MPLTVLCTWGEKGMWPHLCSSPYTPSIVLPEIGFLFSSIAPGSESKFYEESCLSTCYSSQGRAGEAGTWVIEPPKGHLRGVAQPQAELWLLSLSTKKFTAAARDLKGLSERISYSGTISWGIFSASNKSWSGCVLSCSGSPGHLLMWAL